MTCGLASAQPQHGGALMAGIVLTLVIGGICASCWHGIAFTELATIAGMNHVGTVLGRGNTFAFGAYFIVPLVIPFLIGMTTWMGVWIITAGAALLAFCLFPRSQAR